MLSLLAAALVASAPAAPPPAPPRFEELLSRTRKTGKPIFLDIYTQWCGPCRNLERNVFPRPEVQAALARYEFVRYDAEHGPGVAVAERFSIEAYPSMLALTPDGDLVESAFSQDPYELATHLHEIYPVARTRGPLTPKEAARRPQDAGLSFLAGLALLRDREDTQKALALLRRAESADPGNRGGIAALAAQVLARIEGAQKPAAEQAELLASYARRYPTARFAEEAVLGLAALAPEARSKAPVGPPSLDVARGAGARANPEALERLSQAFTILGEHRAAVAAAEALGALEPEDLHAVDVLAEATFQAGDRAQAISLLEKAQAIRADARRAMILARWRGPDRWPPSYPRFYNPLD